MKRFVWYSKVGFLLVALFVLLGGYTPRLTYAEEEEGGCKRDYCSRSSSGSCSCGNAGCKGCFIIDGDTGCGHCSGGSILELE